MRSLLLVLLLGCGPKTVTPTAAAAAPDPVVEMARARPVPDLLRSRFNIKIRSKPLDIAGSTGGGLVTARPGKFHLAVLGPLGSPIVSVTTDGEAMGVQIPKQKRFLLATDAEQVLRETTGGAAGLDDVLSLLVGDLPFDDAKMKSKKAVEGGVEVVFVGPNKTVVTALLDPSNGTPKRIEAHGKKDVLLIAAAYEPFTDVDGVLMPTKVAVEVPGVELTIDLKYKTWSEMDEAPDVFELAPPDGFTTEPLEGALKGLADKIDAEAGKKSWKEVVKDAPEGQAPPE